MTPQARIRLGRRLIGLAAWSSIVVPILVDGVLAAGAHMSNPLWLPHAKLHTAMSFFGAIGLGIGALLLLRLRQRDDPALLGVAAFLATAFWIGLIAAGFWPGTSYDFAGDPAVWIAPPVLAGVPIHLNVVAACLSIALAWLGFALARPSARSETSDPHGNRVP